MAMPSTWAELKTSLATRMIRDDLTDIIPEMIAEAETIFQREVFAPERMETATLSFTGQSASLPSDFWGLRTIYLDATTDIVLEKVTLSFLRSMYPTTATGTPKVYAIEGETIWLGPPPSSGDVEISYWETIPALGDSQSTNWLLTDHPDLYVHASLAELNDYVRDYDEANRHRAKASAIVESINRAGRRRTINSGPLAARSSNTDQVLAYLR